MAEPTREQKRRLGPLTSPFGRYNRLYPDSKRQIGPGEKELYHAIFDATHAQGSPPPNVLRSDPAKIESSKKYLWVITAQGLFIALENVKDHPNKNRDGLCHTNLTGGKKAYQGGELWFLETGSILLNFWSGRYGNPTEDQKLAVVEYFSSVGYPAVQVDETRW